MSAILIPTTILQSISRNLGEQSVDTSVNRIGFLNDAINDVLSEHQWSFRRKLYQITKTNDTEYDLTVIDDYSPASGIYSVEGEDGTTFNPFLYQYRSIAVEPYYYLTPDKKKIGIGGGNVGDKINVYYYAEYQPISSANESFNIDIPVGYLNLITLRCLFLISRRKRQRNDARNYLFDYKEELEDKIFKDASSKSSPIRVFPVLNVPIRD